MRCIKGSEPRIGVCALNPHAGEGGLFGREESLVITPAIKRATDEGIRVEGPVAADAIMVQARDGRFDGLVAMYHDQDISPLSSSGCTALSILQRAFRSYERVLLTVPLLTLPVSVGQIRAVLSRRFAWPPCFPKIVRASQPENANSRLRLKNFLWTAVNPLKSVHDALIRAYPTTTPLPFGGRGAGGEGGLNRHWFSRSTPTMACAHPNHLAEGEGTLG